MKFWRRYDCWIKSIKDISNSCNSVLKSENLLNLANFNGSFEFSEQYIDNYKYFIKHQYLHMESIKQINEQCIAFEKDKEKFFKHFLGV